MGMLALEFDWPNKTFSGAGPMGTVWADPSNHNQSVILPEGLLQNKQMEVALYVAPFNIVADTGIHAGYGGFALGNGAPGTTGSNVALFNIFAVDENGADIEDVFAVIHPFSTTGKLICGFRGAVVLSPVTVSLSLTIGKFIILFTY